MRISGCWFREWIFSAVRSLSSLRLSLALLLGWSLPLLPLLPTRWSAATWITGPLLLSVTAVPLLLLVPAVLSTTSWPRRSHRFLKHWLGTALFCQVVALLPFNGQTELGRLVILGQILFGRSTPSTSSIPWYRLGKSVLHRSPCPWI